MKRALVISITLLFLFHFNMGRSVAPTGTMPTISFVDPTDSDDSYVDRAHTLINVSVSDAESPNDLTAFIDWNDSLRGWWRFNENAGTTLTDYSGNGNHGTLNNFDWTAESDWTTGRWGSALKFDGNNDYVSISDSASLNTADEFTIEAWVKPDSLPSVGNSAVIIMKGVRDPDYDNYLFLFKSDGDIEFRVGNGVTYGSRQIGTLSAGTWYHLVGTFNTTEMKAFRDGNQIGTSLSTGWQAYTNIEPVRINWNWYDYFDGIIDEVRIHNRVLTPEEIKASYNAGLNRLFHNFTNLPESTNKFTAYVQDPDGNVNQTETRTVTIDTIPPVINVISPLNNTVWTTGTIDFIVTFDSVAPKAWYSLDSGPDTKGNNCSGFQTTFDLAEGTHNVTVYANNSFGQLSSTIIYFTVDKNCVSGVTYGEWIITTTLNCPNTELIRHGVTKILSGGALNLDNATLITYGNITVNAGGSFNLNGSTLKMVSIDCIEVYHVDVYGDSDIERSTVISWNPNTNVPAPKSDGYKSYIKFFDNAKVYIANSNLSNLGGSWFGYPNTPGVYFYNVDNPVIQNNVFYNHYYAIKLQNTDGALFANNTIVKGGHSAIWIYSSTNALITNNTAIMADIGISVMYSEDVRIEGNNITNMTTSEDMYNVGIMLWKSDSVTVENNNLTDVGYIGIYVPNNNNNLIIKNNYIDMMEISRKYSNTLSEDWCDPVIGIGIGALLSSWTQGHSSTESNCNRASLAELRSTNVTIEDNTFGASVQVLLFTEGTEDLTHDLTDYWLFSYFYPRITDRDDFYISNNWLELSHVTRLADRTEQFDGPKVITNVMQKIYSHFSPNRGRTVFFNYIVEKGNIKILPQGYKTYTSGEVVNFDDLPHDFYLYYPSYTPFGLNKLSTIYTNGTTHILIYDDLTEPNGYHTINMTVVPSSDSVDVNVINFNTSYKKWTISSGNPSTIVDIEIGDLEPQTEILIKKNGIDWRTYVSDSEGYVSFTYDEGFSTVMLEAYTGSYVPPENCSNLKQGWNLISIPLIQAEQSLTDVLESIDGWYDSVRWYDGADTVDPWKHYKIGKPFGNDLFVLNETMSFWIHITKPGGVVFTYDGNIPAFSQQIHLHKGWNLVGYPSLTSHNRAAGLNNMQFGMDVNCIQWYNATSKTWHFMEEGDHFRRGVGYWIHARDELVWEVPL